MPQLLFPAAFPEGITFLRTYTGVGAIHIGELPGGGYSRIDGQPIQRVDELTAVIPAGARLTKALEWWEHREDEVPEDEPPAVTWRRGKLVYVESGVELSSHAEVIQAFPEESLMQRAALEWFGQRQMQRHQAEPRPDMATGIVPQASPGAPHAPTETRSPSGQFVKRLPGRPIGSGQKAQVKTPLPTST